MAKDIDYSNYDLICIGFPSDQCHPPMPVDEFLQSKFREYHKQGGIRVSSPKSPGESVLIFCTYYDPNNLINKEDYDARRIKKDSSKLVE